MKTEQENSPQERNGALHIPLKILAPLSNIAYSTGKWILIVAMLNIVVLVLVQIFFRYVLNDSLIFPETITKWSMVWAGYIGASIALRDKEHVAITLFVGLFAPQKRFWFQLATQLIVLLFIVMFFYLGVKQAFTNPAFSWEIGIRLMWPMLGIPLAASMMIIHQLYLICESIEKPLYDTSLSKK